MPRIYAAPNSGDVPQEGGVGTIHAERALRHSRGMIGRGPHGVRSPLPGRLSVRGGKPSNPSPWQGTMSDLAVVSNGAD